MNVSTRSLESKQKLFIKYSSRFSRTCIFFYKKAYGILPCFLVKSLIPHPEYNCHSQTDRFIQPIILWQAWSHHFQYNQEPSDCYADQNRTHQVFIQDLSGFIIMNPLKIRIDLNIIIHDFKIYFLFYIIQSFKVLSGVILIRPQHHLKMDIIFYFTELRGILIIDTDKTSVLLWHGNYFPINIFNLVLVNSSASQYRMNRHIERMLNRDTMAGI